MIARKILVVGGGIAGLSFAAAAGQRGMQVDVIEISTKVLGVGIFLASSTLRALDSIGVAHECVRQGWPTDCLELFDGAGNLVTVSPLPRLSSSDLPAGAGIRRPALARILTAAAERNGVQIRLGLTIDDIQQSHSTVTVRCSDGSTGQYDAVIGADGIHSDLRKRVFGPSLRAAHVGQGVWRFTTRRHPAVEGLQLYASGDLKAGFCALDEEWMYLFCTVPDPDRQRVDPALAPALFRDTLSGFEAPLVREMRERLETANPMDVMWRPFEALLVEESWSRGCIVVIGDAAHSMTPHLSSGGGMAIEDAVVLARYLDVDRPVSTVLTDFYKHRINRVRMIQDLSLAISAEETSERPSSERIYGLTIEGYQALSEPFM